MSRVKRLMMGRRGVRGTDGWGEGGGMLGVRTDGVKGLIKAGGVLGGMDGRRNPWEEDDGERRDEEEEEGSRQAGRGRGFVRSKLQKANAGEETGCRGGRITELNVWADHTMPAARLIRATSPAPHMGGTATTAGTPGRTRGIACEQKCDISATI